MNYRIVVDHEHSVPGCHLGLLASGIGGGSSANITSVKNSFFFGGGGGFFFAAIAAAGSSTLVGTVVGDPCAAAFVPMAEFASADGVNPCDAPNFCADTPNF